LRAVVPSVISRVIDLTSVDELRALSQGR
jgi:hypothetical protein